jgi:hypothetical protein
MANTADNVRLADNADHLSSAIADDDEIDLSITEQFRRIHEQRIRRDRK